MNISIKQNYLFLVWEIERDGVVVGTFNTKWECERFLKERVYGLE